MTPRIRLRPFSPEELLALIEGLPQAEARMQLRVAEGLREFFVSGEVSPDWLVLLRASRVADPWIHGFAVVDLDSEAVIGTAGFKGPPDHEGMVEIAYGIVPAYEGRGFATEAAAALVTFAFTDHRVRLIRAHTLPTPNASTSVLTKCQFNRVGEIVDPDDGLVWRWERPRETS
jgi:RimJ/RimL family protein N-acetyltransferase